MSTSVLLLCIAFAGQSSSTTPGNYSNRDGADSKFSDSVFKVPLYPGAKMVVGSSQRIRVDKAKGWLAMCQLLPPGGWGRAYITQDNYKLVESYYRKHGAKYGSANKSLKYYGDDGFTMGFDLPKGEKLIFVGSKLATGDTRYETYYFQSHLTAKKKG